MDRALPIRSHLEQILASRAFQRAETLSRMLRFMVESALAGRRDDLREYVLASEVFGRGSDFDPQNDTIVRVQATRLRARLNEYYESAPGPHPVRIRLFKGSYAPHFETAQAPAPPSIAVLPFQNFTQDAEFGYFTDGLTEEVINALARVEGLPVVARTSAFAVDLGREDVRDIARRLGAALVLEGSVRRDGESIRVTAQLIDAATGHHLMSATFDRQLGSLFEFQEAVSRRILDELRRTAAPRLGLPAVGRRAPHPDAYVLFLKARHQFHRISPEAVQRGMRDAEQALAIDPDFADAYAVRADQLALLGWIGAIPPDHAFRNARTLAEAALTRDPYNAWAASAMAAVSAYEWNVPAAIEWSERAIDASPGDPLSHIAYSYWLLAQRRWEQASAAVRRATGHDPLNPMALFNLGFVGWMAGRDSEVQAGLDRTFEIVPDYPEALCFQGVVHEQRGDFETALDCFTRGQRMHGGAYALEYFPWIYKRLGRAAEAEQAMRTLLTAAGQTYVSPPRMAFACVADEEPDALLGYLDQAFEIHDPRLIWLYVWPVFGHLRDHPRFVELARRVGVHPEQLR